MFPYVLLLTYLSSDFSLCLDYLSKQIEREQKLLVLFHLCPPFCRDGYAIDEHNTLTTFELLASSFSEWTSGVDLIILC